jgi:ABC-type protease/lipase transport system fused ATPase/permease subunit
LYGDPQVVVLDEPNSNLDQDGEAALERTLRELRRAGRTAVVVTHRRNLLAQVDRIVVITEGQVSLAGPRDQVLAALQQAIEPHAPRAAAARGEAANVPAAEAA